MSSAQAKNAALDGEGAPRCPNCGGVVSYDIKSGSFKCRSCGSVCEVHPLKSSVEEYSINDYRVRERSDAALTGVASAKCDSCGGEIYFEKNETAKFCPMCGSPHLRTEVAESGIAPEGLVPFRIDSEDAQQRFRDWIKKRWFAPNQLKRAYGEGALEGLYVPYWTFDADAMAEYSGRGGKTRVLRDREGNTRTVTDWYPVSGRVFSKYDDILVCASQKASGTVIESVAPFNTISDIRPFAVEYLSGYIAERYSLDGLSCFKTARQRMESDLMSRCQSDILARGFNLANVLHFTPKYKDVTYKSVLLPLYTATYGYQGKSYNYAINGQTGRVTGSYPKSAIKIALAVLLAALVFFGLFWLWSSTEASGTAGGYYYPDNNYYYGDYNDYSDDYYDDYFDYGSFDDYF